MKNISKKLLLFILTLALLVSGLAACAGGGEEKPVTISVVNQSEEPLVGIYYEYGFNQHAAGFGKLVNEDGSTLAQEDQLDIVITAEELPKDADLSALQLQLYAVPVDGSRIPVQPLVELSAAYGETYTYVLSGSAGLGFAAVVRTSEGVSSVPG